MENYDIQKKERDRLYKAAGLNQERWQAILQWKSKDFFDVKETLVFSYTADELEVEIDIDARDGRGRIDRSISLFTTFRGTKEVFCCAEKQLNLGYSYGYKNNTFLFIPRLQKYYPICLEVVCVDGDNKILYRYFLLVDNNRFRQNRLTVSELVFSVESTFEVAAGRYSVHLNVDADEKNIERGPKIVNIIDQSVAGAIIGEGKRRMKVDR